jgi:spore coat protein U-like protein
MSRLSLWLKSSFVAAALLPIAMPALAAVDCTVSTVGVAFGVYDPLLAAPDDSTGSVTVSCANTPPPGKVNLGYTISFSTGNSGTYALRQVRSAGFRLDYNLFVDAAHTKVWGDASGGSRLVSGSFSLSGNTTALRAHTIYGRLPAQQDAAPGSYTDTILVTLTF